MQKNDGNAVVPKYSPSNSSKIQNSGELPPTPVSRSNSMPGSPDTNKFKAQNVLNMPPFVNEREALRDHKTLYCDAL